MNDHTLKQKIHSLQDDILRLNNAMFALEASNYKNYPENFLEFSLDTAVRAEKIACKLRHLIGEYGIVKREVLMERVSEAHDIKIEQDCDTVVITIPRLLPKTKRPRSSEFINKPLYYAVSKYCEENRVVKFRECAVCFVHTYDKTLSAGRIRDYDNSETQYVLNTAAAFFMTDDGGRLCDAYHTTELGDKDCTRVYIMSQAALPRFISSLKDTPNTMSKITENL